MTMIDLQCSTTVAGPGCIAHRGASGVEPENTLRAFRRALEMGADWLELDVRALQGRVVVLHDASVDRTTSGHGTLSSFDLDALRRLDAGDGERIPFLEEVLKLAGGRAGLHVELKGAGVAAPAAALLRKAVARGSWRSEDLVVSSFDWSQLAEFGGLLPDVPRALLASKRTAAEALEVANELGVTAIHLEKWAVRESLVEEARERGLKVRAFTVNDRWEYEFMRRVGLADVFSDRPDRVLVWRDLGHWNDLGSP